MLGNISKKKGDNGDFYTKPVIDKKLKDTETAVRAYTNEAVADAKNDLYAEVGEKVGAVEETVKAKLDSTDTKLDTKVDKVGGKSLIDSGVADNLKYSQMEGSGRLSFDGEIKATHIQAVAIDAEHGIHCGGDVGVNVGDVFTTRMDDDTGSPVTHYLSKKANAADIVNKVDKIEGKSLIDENVADRLSYDSTTTNIVVSSISQGIEALNFIGMDGNASISANGLISGQHLTIETDGADNIPGVVGIEAKNGDVTANVCIDPNSGAYKLHKLSEKANSADIGTLSDLTTTDKSSVVAAINEVKSSGGGDVLDNLTYDSTNDIINSDANLLLTNTNSVAAYNGTFRGDIKIGQLGANKWAYTISPITGFSTSVDVTCTSGNVVHNLSAKADTTNVLTRNNTQTFTPTGDYQPATKKYVDDTIKVAIEKYNTEAMTLLGED